MVSPQAYSTWGLDARKTRLSTPGTHFPKSDEQQGIHFKTYGLGWGLFDYKGKMIVGHSGGYDGMISYTVLVPEEALGFVILTNKNSTLYLEEGDNLEAGASAAGDAVITVNYEILNDA